MSTNFRNIFGTIVHDIPEGLSPIEFRNLYGTLVHNIPEGLSPIEFRNLYGTLSHSEPSISGSLSDITGTVNVSASFDATNLGFSTSSANFQWTWQSVPASSTIINQSLAMPDGQENTYFDMTANQGLWHFEGNADDTSGNGNNGTVFGASVVAGKVGFDAYSFNGSNNRIDVGSAFAYTTEDFSLAFWVKEGVSQSGFVNIFGNQSSQRGFCLENDSAGSSLYRVVAGDGGWTFGTPTELLPGVWTHLAITRNGSTVKIFNNGSLVATDTGFPVAFSAATIPMWLGANQASGRYWQGTLDEFAIWTRTLSDLEVNNLYFLQSGSMATDLAGNIGLGDIFTFVSDVSGTFTTNLSITDGINSLNGNINAIISAAPTPPPGPITGSNPTAELVEAGDIGYTLNTYKIQNVQRSRTTEQIPFKLGAKGRQSLRLRTNTEFTGSS